MNDGRRIGVIGEIMPTFLDHVLTCPPGGADITASDLLVLTYPERVDQIGPPSTPPAVVTVDGSMGCLREPTINLASEAGPVRMDLIAYSELTSTCALEADGEAMFDDAFRPATALVVSDGAVAITADTAGEVAVDTRPFAAGERLAAVDMSPDVLAVSSDGTYPITLPEPGCFVVMVRWQAEGRSGTYVALAESAPGSCPPAR